MGGLWLYKPQTTVTSPSGSDALMTYMLLCPYFFKGKHCLGTIHSLLLYHEMHQNFPDQFLLFRLGNSLLSVKPFVIFPFTKAQKA